MLAIALALRNGPQLVGLAAGTAGVIFFVMALIATTAKRDFSFMGKFLSVGMVLLLLAVIASMFLHVTVFALTVSALIVILFTVFLLYEVSRIVNGGETNYILATTSVYLSLFNIFANLLRILIAFSGNRN